MPTNEADIRNAAIEEGAWQPISTVENGSEVLIFDPKHRKVYHALAWKNGEYADPIYTEWDGSGATHWMPLPKPPEPVPDPKPFTFADPSAQREWERHKAESKRREVE